MERTNYTPFMKLKANEVGAVAELSEQLKQRIIPFFDLPRKDGMTEESFHLGVEKAARKVERLLGKDMQLYLDNFDIPDDLRPASSPTYEFVIEEFSKTAYIPVLGLDRIPQHGKAIFDAKRRGLIRSNTAALRLTVSEFQDYSLVEADLSDLLTDGNCFENWTLILDCKTCEAADPAAYASMLIAFIGSVRSLHDFHEIIVTGSSLPASIADIAKVETEVHLRRVELEIYARVRSRDGRQNIGMGDYTVVSPMYSDLNIPPEMMLNRTAPKVIYSYDDLHFVARGGALKTHKRGYSQYNDIAARIVAQPFYRNPPYSFGDNFIYDRAKGLGNKVTPGSILKPTINAHITYMAMDQPLLA